MSFVRANRNHPSQGRRKKPVTKKKPLPWDDTLNDLTAYRATPDEIAYRRASHQSKHAVVSRLNRLPGSARKGKRTSPYKSNAQAHKMAIMKEVLYDQQQLQDVLEKSDSMMAMVKDLFGDDPRRFAGFPSVTTAPNSEKQSISSSLVKQHPEIQTNSEFLSDSVMDGSALNDVHSDSEGDDNASAKITYQPKMNMQRFQQFLEAEEKNTTLSTISGQAGMSHLGHGTFNQMVGAAVHSSQLPDQTGGLSQDGTFQTPPKKGLDESIAILRPPKSAINATDKVKKTKPRVPQTQAEHNTSSYSLPDLKKVLVTLETEIEDYERQTGRRAPTERPRHDTFSGYTLAIVDSVTKLTRYLKECEMRLHAEMTVREQLAQDVVQYKSLVDALTSDIIMTQEEFASMSSQFQKFRSETRTEIQTLKGISVVLEAKVSPANITKSPDQPFSMVSSAPNTARSGDDPPTATNTPPRPGQQQLNPQPVAEANLPREINPFGDHLKPVSAAVMLSPPVRRSRVMEPEREIDAARRQAGLLNMQEYLSGEDTNNSALQEDYVDLPGVSQLPAPSVSYPGPALAQRKVGTTLPGAGDGLVPATKQARGQTKPLPTATLNTVNVPRPRPLVQTNTGIPISSVTNGNRPSQPLVQREAGPPTLSNDQSTAGHMGVSSMHPSSDRDFLSSQIAELNKQHEEAQRRLNGLMLMQQVPGLPTNPPQGQVNPVPSALQQQQNRDMPHQQHNIIAQEQSAPQQRQFLQQQQHLQKDQQEKLAEMVMQQQQRMIDQQQRLQQQAKQLQQQNHDNMKQRLTLTSQEGHQQLPEQQGRLPRPNIPPEMRQSTDIPGYRPAKQSGLPACPVSPNISPISQQSDNFRMMRQSVDSQNVSLMAPASRGITVSIPKVHMDLSPGSPSPNPETAR